MSGGFKVEYSKAARRRLRRLPNSVTRTIVAKINGVARDPSAANNNVSRLTGVDGYRLRVGNWRVLYTLDTESNLLTVAAILPRGEAYR